MIAVAIFPPVESVVPVLVALRTKPIAAATAAIAAEPLSLRFGLESLPVGFAANLRRLIAGLVSFGIARGFTFSPLGAFLFAFVVEILRETVGLRWRSRRLHRAQEPEIMLGMLLIVFRLDAIAR
jgi:hypothetical protein